MKLLPKIRKVIKPFLTQYGFSSKGGYFYKIQNDIAFCVGFERPSDLVYTMFYIIPLYMNTEMHYLTYGNRINNLYYDQLPQLTSASAEEDIVAWCNTLISILEEDILPFFNKISSPDKILAFLNENPQEVMKYMFCGDWDIARLRVFTFLYLHEYNRMADEVERYRLALRNAPLIEKLKTAKEIEIALLKEISLQGDSCVDEYFRQVSLKSTSVCF